VPPFDQEEAALKAVLEALQLRPWLRSERNSLRRLRSPSFGYPIRTIRQRASLLLRQDYADAIQKWIDDTDEPSSPHNHAVGPEQLAQEVEAQGASVIVIDLSERLPRTVRATGIKVAKVIVPELQPLWLNDYAKDISWKRVDHYSTCYGVSLCTERNSCLIHFFRRRRRSVL
jgi:ribosomal protein S12 methylthiotransferase accessory factor YcaO